MLDPNMRKFLFKCADCAMIISLELIEEEDIASVQEGQYVLECPCGEKSYVLRD